MGATQSLDPEISNHYMKDDQKYYYGWKPDLPDIHDKYYQFDKIQLNDDQTEDDDTDYDSDDQLFKIKGIDLRDQFPEPYDQEDLHTSTSCAVLSVWQYFNNKENSAFNPSRIHLYHLTSHLENGDRSISIKNTLKVLEKVGVVSEDIIGYGEYPDPEETFLGIPTNPPKNMKYRRVEQTKEQLKRAVESGYPVIFGLSVYSSMLTDSVAKNGIIKMPSKSDQVIGGQTMVLVGYDNQKKSWLCRNSWGRSWGDGGYCWIPFQMLTNPLLARDFWVITKI